MGALNGVAVQQLILAASRNAAHDQRLVKHTNAFARVVNG